MEKIATFLLYMVLYVAKKCRKLFIKILLLYLTCSRKCEGIFNYLAFIKCLQENLAKLYYGMIASLVMSQIMGKKSLWRLQPILAPNR
jgi:hypothetical protein